MATVFPRFKDKIYYHRAFIPGRLQPYFNGRSQLWRSLRTDDQELAVIRSAQWTARIHRLFRTLKRQGASMTNSQRDELVTRWIDAELDEADDWRALNGPITDECRDGMTDLLADKRQEVECALMGSDYQIIEKEADELLAAAGLSLLDHSSEDFKRLCHRLLVGKQDVLRIDQARWDGDYTERPASCSTVAAPPPQVKPAAPSKPFTEVVKLYFQENTRAVRTDSQVKAELERFIVAVGGDKAIGTITKADCCTYKEHMLQVRKLTLATVIKHLSSLAVLFKWSEAQGFTPDGSNPVRGLAPNKKQAKKQSTKRRPFTDAELLTVFGSQEFLRQRNTNLANYWLPLLCLFSACRREEAGQLAIKDIGEADGIPFMNITEEAADQGLKSPGTARRLPMHPALIQLGFMEYVDSIRNAGHARLFPKLTHGSNGYSDAVGKWFSRLVTQVGLTDPALVLHSLRHGGISKLTGSGCPHNICEMLAGHAAAGVHRQTYVHRETIPLSLLREGLEKLKYDAVVKALAG